jgi:hypothetical protein
MLFVLFVPSDMALCLDDSLLVLTIFAHESPCKHGNMYTRFSVWVADNPDFNIQHPTGGSVKTAIRFQLEKRPSGSLRLVYGCCE